MCAIARIISKKSKARLDPKRAEEMISAIRHRGPDETGYYRTERIQLAMARLSILDLKSKGLCPIVHPEPAGDQVLVYNGEIYNYVALRDELKAKVTASRQTVTPRCFWKPTCSGARLV
jgi:asparagine synthase (glutamine-hydrolysing)